ncbi:MAG: DUF4416 family protein [Nitrospirae bacterium]|nr:DUF4416 family protein [Nitrospirota bacterium]
MEKIALALNNKKINPRPATLFVGMISQDISMFGHAKEELMDVFGSVSMESPVWEWDHTDYYKKEMGAGLKRQFIFFRKLINPETIPDVKLRTIAFEKKNLDENGGRRINLDPGYLDSAKVVLASTKDFSHRIYLGKGIYGEVTLVYSGKGYQILPYTFPDFRKQEYMEVFEKAREIYKKGI